MHTFAGIHVEANTHSAASIGSPSGVLRTSVSVSLSILHLLISLPIVLGLIIIS